ncbi:hypothetical protein F3K53_20585 [Pseudomonas veronii]|uniref:Peptidase M10 serralysin C-terminal domain-containing protein n=2 Tax=Pseudomonas TaxID=286 RepID=A0A5M8ER22_PSEVE|nr:hypothetical protein F3K53_20585 [Pseudomonas veronii]KAA6176708.1 hypothetical protein F3K54_13175 [Pseudomonas veronii]
MSAIHQIPTPHSARPPSQHRAERGLPPASSVVTTQALEALLRSGPNHARQPKRPDNPEPAPSSTATMKQSLTDLGAQVNRSTVEHMLRDPTSRGSIDTFNKIGTLLTTDKISTLLSGPDANDNVKVLEKVESQLSKDAIDTVLSPFEAEQVDSYRNHVESALFDLKYRLMTAPLESRFDLVRRFASKKHEPLLDIQDNLAQANARATSLCSISALVRKAIGSLKFPHPTDLENRIPTDTPHKPCTVRPNIYRYTSIQESSLDAPSEVRDFVHGQDKLDVSGIRRQLNKPLQWVHQLSGASGEMQLKYSPTTNTSVLVISGNPSEPAFVAKIFGQLKETDLLS